jgi:hypothetical protein
MILLSGCLERIGLRSTTLSPTTTILGQTTTTYYYHTTTTTIQPTDECNVGTPNCQEICVSHGFSTSVCYDRTCPYGWEEVLGSDCSSYPPCDRCCCSGTATTTTQYDINSASECVAWRDQNNMEYYTYDPWGGMESMLDCYNNANGYCTQFGWTLANYNMKMNGCCIFECNKPTTTTTTQDPCISWCQGEGFNSGINFAETGWNCYGWVNANICQATHTMDNGQCCCWTC